MKVLVFLCLIAGAFAFPAEEADCSARPDPGLCDAYMPRYYYNEIEGRCKQFIYGGCGGNSNNFRTEEDCNRACTDLQDAPSMQKASVTCSQDKEVGVCRANLHRFYYNKNTGECEEFIYGGCKGNSNNFFSKEDCEAVCVDHL